MPYQTVNPATGEVLQVFKEHTDQQMMDALSLADKTYRQSWSAAPYKERAKYIGKAAALMLQQKEELARLPTI
jgi:succinate-semialdehyde dehydrogenase / glutarate-semialdehyde dehydrogenase